MDRIEIEERRGVEYAEALDEAAQSGLAVAYLEDTATTLGALAGEPVERIAELLADDEPLRAVADSLCLWRGWNRLTVGIDRGTERLALVSRPGEGRPLSWRASRLEAARIYSWQDRSERERREVLMGEAREIVRECVAGPLHGARGVLTDRQLAELETFLGRVPGARRWRVLVRCERVSALVDVQAVRLFLDLLRGLGEGVGLRGLAVRDVQVTAADAEAVRS